MLLVEASPQHSSPNGIFDGLASAMRCFGFFVNIHTQASATSFSAVIQFACLNIDDLSALAFANPNRFAVSFFRILAHNLQTAKNLSGQINETIFGVLLRGLKSKMPTTFLHSAFERVGHNQSILPAIANAFPYGSFSMRLSQSNDRKEVKPLAGKVLEFGRQLIRLRTSHGLLSPKDRGYGEGRVAPYECFPTRYFYQIA
jgi:hypothetical protein